MATSNKKKNGLTKRSRNGKKSANMRISTSRPQQVLIKVQQVPTIPTASELTEPMRENTKLTIPKTWISGQQLIRLTEKTPPSQVYQRPGKGGGKWDYVTVSYVQRLLDYVFGWNWDFEIVEHGKEADHVWVLGKLVVRSPDGTQQITKTQFGRSEVKHKREGGNLDYGNDLKSAASDALKKCASMLGIARDIYGKTDYRAESGNEPRDAQASPQALPQASKQPSEPIYCHGEGKRGCPEGNEMSQPERDYSMRVYGKPLCRNCQKNSSPVKNS